MLASIIAEMPNPDRNTVQRSMLLRLDAKAHLHTWHMQRLHNSGRAHSMQCHAEKRCLSLQEKSTLNFKSQHAPSGRAVIGLCQLSLDATSSQQCSASAWQILWPYTSTADSAHFCWPCTLTTKMVTYHGIVSCVIFLHPFSL